MLVSFDIVSLFTNKAANYQQVCQTSFTAATSHLTSRGHHGIGGSLPEDHLFSGKWEVFQQNDGMVMGSAPPQLVVISIWRI
jgi:hypothetical protein